jgi:cephalosporin hydroxylase
MNRDPKDRQRIREMADDAEFRSLSHEWFLKSCTYRYSYNFKWLGRPIIQYPQDIVALQEVLWEVQPDLVVETGVAHGGSLILSASILELLGGIGEVIGIDIDIRSHNREAIQNHALAKRVRLIEGSSIAPEVFDRVRQAAQGRRRVLVVLDSNHTHQHVREELRLYSTLVRKGSYLIVFDTVVDDMPAKFFADRPWGPGNSPKTAVREFLAANDRFSIDEDIQERLAFTVAPEGYLKCVKD